MKQLFNWQEFLDRPDITKEEWEEARRIANKWNPITEHKVRRFPKGLPMNIELATLEQSFYNRIECKDYKGAKLYLVLIKKKSEEIKEK